MRDRQTKQFTNMSQSDGQGNISTRGKGVSRRDFLSVVSAAATVSIVSRSVLGGAGRVAPSDRVNIGSIGVGGQGLNDMQAFLGIPNAQVVAVCDIRRECDYSKFYYGGVAGREPARQLVNDTYASQKNVAKYDGCASYVDFHELLQHSGLDAVHIATPDHMHAIPAMAAIRQGKHVYCQKPLTYTVRESRELGEAARQQGVVTQMGHQLHATDKLKRLVEMIQSGAIGQVQEIHCWAGSTYGGLARPEDTPPIPDGFEWDQWIGPAPFRPYHPDYAPFRWRHWKDFGTASLGDFGCHIMDPAMWAVGFAEAMTIEASSSPHFEDSYSVANIVRYRFLPPGRSTAITLTWYDGGLKPFRPAELESGRDLPNSGGMYIGDQGTIVARHGGDAQLIPAAKMEKYSLPEPFLPRGETHYEEWVRACQSGPLPLSNFSDYAGPLTEMILLGNIAIETQRRLEWDSQSFKITNDEEANRRLHREYREGWTL